MSELVVVGVDSSPASYAALRWALTYSGRIGARVRAVRCWMPVMARGWEAAVTERVSPPAEQQARAERELAAAEFDPTAFLHDEGDELAVVRHLPVRSPRRVVRNSLSRLPAGLGRLVAGADRRRLQG
ncbi:MAG: universal stress protein [Pseudonocardiales bacterium]